MILFFYQYFLTLHDFFLMKYFYTLFFKTFNSFYQSIFFIVCYKPCAKNIYLVFFSRTDFDCNIHSDNFFSTTCSYNENKCPGISEM